MPELQTQRVYPLNGGMVDAVKPYLLQPNQFENLKNCRVWRGEVRAAKGYVTSTSSPVIAGVTAVKDLSYAVRNNGTTDLIATTDGSQWRLVGDARTLLSVYRGRLESIAEIANTGASTIVYGCTAANQWWPGGKQADFRSDYGNSDKFYAAGDTSAHALEIAEIYSYSAMRLEGTYGGSKVSGTPKVWPNQTDEETVSLYWAGRWFFVNGRDKLAEYSPSEAWRRTGLPAGSDDTWADIAAVAGGSLTANSTFYYKYCFQDGRGVYGNPSSMALSAATDATNKQIVLSALSAEDRFEETNIWAGTATSKTGPAAWCSAMRLYRKEAVTGTYHYVGSFSMSATSVVDDGTTNTDTDTLPAYNDQAPAGFEDLAVVDNRLVAISGQHLWVSGLPPTDVHTDSAGRGEPDYWSVSHRIGDGEGTDVFSFVTVAGKTFIVGKRNTYAIDVTSDDPSVWAIPVKYPNVGCEYRKSIAEAGDRAYWLGRFRGRLTVFEFNGSRIGEVGAPMRGTLDDFNTASSAAEQIKAGVGKGFYWLCIPLASGGYRTLEYNSENGTWCWRDWQVQQFANGDSEVYAAMDDGIVYKLESGSAQGATAQEYVIQTGPVDLGVPEWPKRFHSVQAEFYKIAGNPELSGSYIVDEDYDGASSATLANSPYALTAGALSAEPIIREGLQTPNYGKRLQFQWKASGTDLDFAYRGYVVKGEIEQRDVD